MAPPLGSSSQRQHPHHHHVSSSSAQQHQRHPAPQHHAGTYAVNSTGGGHPPIVMMEQQQQTEQQRANSRVDQAESRVDGLLQELEDLRFLEELEQTKAAVIIPVTTTTQRSQSVPRMLSSSTAPTTYAVSNINMTKTKNAHRHSTNGGTGGTTNSSQQRHNAIHGTTNNDSSNADYMKTPRGDTIPAVIRAMSPPPNRRLPPPERPSSSSVVIMPQQQQQQHRSSSPNPMLYHSRTTSTNNSNTGRSQSVQRSESIVQQQRSQSVQRPPMMAVARAPSRSRGLAPPRATMMAAVPLEEFPPPPPDQIEDEPLPTPRQVSKMERMDLELQVQKLVRRCEIVQQHKIAADQELRVYQLSNQDHGHTIETLERTIHDVRDELDRSRTEWRLVRQQLLDERDELIQTAVQRTKRNNSAEINELESQVAQVSDLADELQGKLVISSTMAKSLEQDLTLERQARQSHEASARQEKLQLEDTVKKLEQRLADAQRQAHDEYELKLSTLEEELKLRSIDQTAQSDELADVKTKLAAELARNRQLEVEKTEQDELIQEMTDRLDKVHEEYKIKFTELKGAYERKEKRRCNDAQLVKDEFQIKLANLQQQLLAETASYEVQVARQQSELEAHHASQLERLRHDQAESMRRLQDQVQDAEQQLTQMRLDRECQEMVQQQDIIRWRESSNRLETELAERDESYQSLQREMVALERTHETKFVSLKQAHQLELRQCEESSSRSVRSAESSVKTELAKKEKAFQDQQNLLERQLADLNDTLDDVREQAHEAHKVHKATESELRVQLSILQGKITATDATAQERRSTISTLQDQLDVATKQFKDAEGQVQDLTSQLQSAESALALERENHSTKLKEVHCRMDETTNETVSLQRQLSDAVLRERSALERADDRETACQKAQSELIQERARSANMEEELRSDLAVLQGRLKANETSLSEKRATIEELQDQLQSIADESSSTTRELQRQLERIREESGTVKTQLDAARADLFAKEGIMKQKEKKITESTRIILALEAKMAKHTEGELNVNQTIKDLKNSLDQSKKELQTERIRFKNVEESLNAKVADLTDKIEQYQCDGRKQAEENSRLKESLTQVKDESQDLVSGHHDQVRKLQDELEEIKSLLVDERQIVVAKDEEIRRLDEELQTTTKGVARSVDTSRQNEEQLQREVSALQSKVQELQELLDSHQQQAASSVSIVETKTAGLECQLHESRSALEDKENVVRDLTIKLDGASKELQGHENMHREALQIASFNLAFVEKQLAQQKAATDAKEETVRNLQEENRILVDKTIRLADADGKIASLEDDLRRTHEQKRSQLAEIVRLQSIGDTLPSSAELDTLRRKIELECEAKREVANQLATVQSEVLRERQLMSQLQSELSVIKRERDELSIALKEIEDKLATTERDIVSRAVALSSADESRITIDALRSDIIGLTKENGLLKEELRTTVHTFDVEKREMKTKLDAAIKQSDDLNLQLTSATIGHEEELERKIDQFKKEKATLEAKISEFELDSQEREKDMKEANDRYSDTLVELKVKVGQLTHDKETLKNSLSQARADLDARDERSNATSTQMAVDFADLQSKLDAQIAANEELRRSVAVLREKASDIELAKSKLEMESRDNRSLRNKNRDNEAELKRKETQLEDVVAKYSKEIAELNSHLEDERAKRSRLSNEDLAQMEKTLVTQQATNERLQKEIEVLRSQASAVDFESLNEDLKRLSESNERLQAKLVDVEREKSSLLASSADAEDASRTNTKDLKDKLKKATAERAEVVNALEEVLNEVQEREDEIDSLEALLHKRDEELEHAKLIAAKALASAQEIKARYKGRGADRSDLSPKIAELDATVDKLQKENEKLRRHTAKLMKDLEAKNPDLRVDRRPMNSSQKLNRFINQQSNNDGDGFASFDDEGFPAFPACSPTQADSLVFNDTMSTQSGQIRAGSSWLHEFETKSADSEDRSMSTRTEPSDSRSDRPKSRDAMHNFYRNRYMKSKV